MSLIFYVHFIKKTTVFGTQFLIQSAKQTNLLCAIQILRMRVRTRSVYIKAYYLLPTQQCHSEWTDDNKSSEGGSRSV